MNVDGAGAAKRRRERRQRAMPRHERQKVAMELAAALHHSRDVWPTVTYKAPRRQKTASSRPGILPEPAPQGMSVAPLCLGSGAAPGLAHPVLARRVCAEAVMRVINRRVRDDLPLTEAKWAAWRQWSGLRVDAPFSSVRGGKGRRGGRSFFVLCLGAA